MHEDHPARVDSVVDEAACAGEVDEEVGVIDVLDSNAEMADPGRRVVCGDRFRSDGDDMRYASVCKGPRRNGSVDPAGWGMQKRECSMREGLSAHAVRVTTYVPKKSLPSMTALMFLQTILVALCGCFLSTNRCGRLGSRPSRTAGFCMVPPGGS